MRRTIIPTQAGSAILNHASGVIEEHRDSRTQQIAALDEMLLSAVKSGPDTRRD
ncbi:hypothetical protein KAJ77_11370 [bacterium]|nr:hypothetical protein [bacterium]